jgi:hypothetical protein
MRSTKTTTKLTTASTERDCEAGTKEELNRVSVIQINVQPLPPMNHYGVGKPQGWTDVGLEKLHA